MPIGEHLVSRIIVVLYDLTYEICVVTFLKSDRFRLLRPLHEFQSLGYQSAHAHFVHPLLIRNKWIRLRIIAGPVRRQVYHHTPYH